MQLEPFSSETLAEAKDQGKFACAIIVDLKPTEKGGVFAKMFLIDADEVRRLHAFIGELRGQSISDRQQGGLLGEILKGGA